MVRISLIPDSHFTAKPDAVSREAGQLFRLIPDSVERVGDVADDSAGAWSGEVGVMSTPACVGRVTQ